MKHEKTALRLREALSDSNMTAKELSQKSKVSEASISQYYNGSHSPSNISSAKMGNVLNVNPLWLMGFDVDKVEQEPFCPNEQYSFKAETPEQLMDVIKNAECLDELEKEKILSIAKKMFEIKNIEENL